MTKKCDSSENKEIRGASTEAGCDRPACDKQTSGELQSWFKQNFPALYPPNAEQAEIIADHGLNTLVTARAGSGKTTMLIYKVLYLVAHEHVSPDQILLLAFNKNAAVLLRERLFKALVSREEYRYFLEYIRTHGIRSGYERDKVLNDALAANRITLPHIMTFHALAYRIVRPAAKSFQMNNDTSSLHRLAFDQALAEDLKDDNAAEDYMKLFREYQADTEKGSGEILYTLDGKAVLDFIKNNWDDFPLPQGEYVMGSDELDEGADITVCLDNGDVIDLGSPDEIEEGDDEADEEDEEEEDE